MVHEVTRESLRIEKHQWVLDKNKDEISIKISPNLLGQHWIPSAVAPFSPYEIFTG